jgi:hypothetical protein
MDESGLAIVTTFEGLRRAFDLRKRELRLTNLALDDIAGLQSGYTGKLLCGTRRVGEISLPALLGALGLEIVLVRSRATDRGPRLEEFGVHEDRLKKVMSERGKKGGKRKALRMTAEERSKEARRINKIRWDRKRAEERERKKAQEKPAKSRDGMTMSQVECASG